MRALLIAEDDPENQRYLAALLQRHYAVTICATAEEAMEHASRTGYEACIIDISLGGKMTGLDIIRNFRASERDRTMPVICLTAHAFGEDRINAMEAGADIFLKKPVANHVLLGLLEELITARRQ